MKRKEMTVNNLKSIINNKAMKNITKNTESKLNGNNQILPEVISENNQDNSYQNRGNPELNSPFSSKLLDRSFGWLNNDEEGYPDLACSCASCCSNSITANSTTSESIGTTLTSESSLTSTDIDTLLTGYQWGFSWGDRTISYSFYNADNYYGNTSVMPVSEGIKTNVREIFSDISQLIDVDFVEVDETNGDFGRIRFLLNPSTSYAYAYYPVVDTLDSKAGDVNLSSNYDLCLTVKSYNH